ncbi:DUF1298 domain-containing protein [Mycobacterium simiae]|uniref:diacylglycerol O-acyltransferase n=1 Tax=Mycobacterium simiae TaxID=1784 RepID=A0A5B1BMV6_MYCSI|nr:wax ester/triacylglycerol synthase domain-containing protein [Mycobacterium simiae]KAA1249726.1 DUF1298 domain-containing protein [Mycobacterium simiae]
MVQLTTLDTGFLKAHDPYRQASLAIGAVAVVNGAAPNFDHLKEVVAERIQSIPRHAQVLRGQWIDHPERDLAKHLRRVALPRPGGDSELCQAIANALQRPLDFNRPLWECWIIEGLEGNRWAILLKIHHCMADGIPAAQLLTKLCDEADEAGTEAFTAFTDHVAVKPVSRSPRHNRSQTDPLWRLPAAVTTTVVKAAARAVTWPVSWSSPHAPPTTKQRYGTVRIPLTDVDRICRKFDVTIDDVALAAISEGFRTVLLRRGEQPRADSLRTREPTASSISTLLPYLPVEHDDPIRRLRIVHQQLQQPQPSGRDRPAGLSARCAKAIHALIRLPQRSIVTLTTHASGPRHRLRLMGQTMEQVLPIPPTALPHSTGVAVLTYGDELVFGITVDDDAAHTMAQLATGIERGAAHLTALSHDSVVLFGRDRKRSYRSRTGGGHGRAYPPPAWARR